MGGRNVFYLGCEPQGVCWLKRSKSLKEVVKAGEIRIRHVDGIERLVTMAHLGGHTFTKYEKGKKERNLGVRKIGLGGYSI